MLYILEFTYNEDIIVYVKYLLDVALYFKIFKTGKFTRTRVPTFFQALQNDPRRHAISPFFFSQLGILI